MRHVSTADLHANAVELAAAIRAGDEVMVSLDGCEYRLVADGDALPADRQQAMDEAAAFRQRLRDRGVRITHDDIRGWIEGRH